MPEHRFFAPQPFTTEPIILTGKESHHLCRVMRIKVGDIVEVINGQGEIAKAVVKNIDRDSTRLSIQAVEKYPPPQKTFRLIQGIPHMARLEILLEKCIELGCTEFWFFAAAKSEFPNLSTTKKERLEYIAISALKQCGSYYLPNIVWIDSIAKSPPPTGPLFFGDLRKEAPYLTHSADPCTFINGPESGLTEKEISYFETVWKAKGVSLHHNTLRTETAAIAATTLYTQH
jgi:16S rRNA (uracil1498-N3)-methyltransferase